MSNDVQVINWMQNTFGESSRYFFELISVLGGPYGWLFVVPLVFWFAGSKAGLRVTLAICIAMIANTLLKWSIGQPRPYYVSDQVKALQLVDGFGMPSGHAQGVATQWCMLAYSLRKSWCVWLALFFIIFTGASRVYLGVHSHQQVAIGWALGLITVFITVRLEGTVVDWFRSKPFAIQFACILGTTAAIIVTGYAVAHVRSDQAVQLEWQTHWEETLDRLVLEDRAEADETEFNLIRPPRIVMMACLFLGCSICGWWLLRTGEINPDSTRHRMANLAVGVPLLALIALVIRPQLNTLIGETATLAAIAVTLPSMIGVVVPSLTLRLFAQSDGPTTRSDAGQQRE